MVKKKKARVDLRKNRSKPPRAKGWTKGFHEHGFEDEAPRAKERVRAKGDLSRRRTIIVEEAANSDTLGGAATVMPVVDFASCLPGRVLRVQGLYSLVESEESEEWLCQEQKSSFCIQHLAISTRSNKRTHRITSQWSRQKPSEE